MVDNPTLSICIPTYNFGAFIGKTLASIVSQLTPQVEVVILDGGSTDNTEDIVRSFQGHYPSISYFKQEVRGGIDRDMARVIELASGNYCWLFSADDIMIDRAVATVLTEVKVAHDIYVSGLTLCTRELEFVEEHKILRAPFGSVFHLEEVPDRRLYFESAETTTAFFSFLGSIILRRQRWLEQPLEESYIGSCWAHVVRIMRMIPHGLSVKYIGKPLLKKRSDNDSFMDRGIVHRYSIAIDGYHRIAREVFGAESFEAWHIRRVIVNEFPPRVMLFAKEVCVSQNRTQDLRELGRLARLAYSDRTLRNLIYLSLYLTIPGGGYGLARKVYRRLKAM